MGGPEARDSSDTWRSGAGTLIDNRQVAYDINAINWFGHLMNYLMETRFGCRPVRSGRGRGGRIWILTLLCLFSRPYGTFNRRFLGRFPSKSLLTSSATRGLRKQLRCRFRDPGRSSERSCGAKWGFLTALG